VIKNIIISIFLMFVSFNTSISQNLSLRFYGGTSFYYSKGKQILDSGEEVIYRIKDGEIGYVVGYGIEYSLSKKIIIDANFEFSERNENRSLEKDDELFFRYHYVSIWPSIGYKATNNLSIKGGVQFDYLLGKKKFSYIDWINEESNFSPYDLGLTFNIGYKISQFEIFGTYFHGLPYVVFHDREVTLDTASTFTKSRMFKFGVAYLMN